MDTWRSELRDMLGDMSREDIEAVAYIIEMAERDYENHLQKQREKLNGSCAKILIRSLLKMFRPALKNVS